MKTTDPLDELLASLPFQIRQYVIDLADSRKISLNEAITLVLANEVNRAGINPYGENVKPQYWVRLQPAGGHTLVKVSSNYIHGRLFHGNQEPRFINVPNEIMGNERFVFACEMKRDLNSDIVATDDFIVFRETDEISHGDLALFQRKDGMVLINVVCRDGAWVNYSPQCAKNQWVGIEEIRVMGVAIAIIKGLTPNAEEGPGSALADVLKR